jgi:two-component system chemotaxis response regulator CheY
LYDSTFLRRADPSLVPFKDTAAQDITIIEKDGIYYREGVTLCAPVPQVEFLLADDSRFMRTTLARIVKDIGGEVVGEATSGNEAIDMFARLRPDVVTMDLSMPGVSGVEAIQGILQIDPDVSIIVISGIEMQELREQVFNLGVKMFITKPFNPKEVSGILSEQMSMEE